MADITAFQQAVLDRLDAAVQLGVIALAIALGLLAIIAVRSLWS